MRLIKAAALATSMIVTSAVWAQADVKVVTSIKPLHSLASAVMKGVGVPSLIVEGAGSPHNYALKPSQAKDLQEADLIFWIGHDFEAFLENSIENIAAGATAVSLMESHGLEKLKFREGGAFDDHGHEDHDADDDHDDHAHDDHDDHEDHAHDDHDDHEEHAHGAYDAHIWLDPKNAKAIVHEMEEHLVEIDPANAATYEANAAAVMAQLDNLIVEIQAELEPVKDQGYIVFHDAYQYFENRFGISAIGSITVSPEVIPGAKRTAEIRDKIKSLEASCVFSEPQFQPKLIQTVTEGTNAGTGVIDPLGATIKDGDQLYFTLIRNMAKSLKDCLSR